MLAATMFLPKAEAAALTQKSVMDALPKLEALANKLVERKSGPGESGSDKSVPGLSVAVVFQNKLVYLKGFGLREIGKPERVDADTVFQLASLSKPITSTIVAAMIGKDIASWDAKIADLDPGFRLADPYPTSELTLTDLFAHRSGLPGDAGNELEAIGYDRAEILRRLRFVPPASSFRAGYSYSNFGFTEGGAAAARAVGKPWEEVAEDKLFKPLGMTSTSARYADFVNRSNRAALHILDGGQWRAAVKRRPDAQAPAGGVSSTARDLAKWMLLELDYANGRAAAIPINPEAIARTHAPLIDRGKNPVTGAASFYGLGWNAEFGARGPEWGHAAAFSAGARTLVKLSPGADLGIVVLANAFPTGAPEGLADSFFDLVFDGRVGEDWFSKWNRLFASMFDQGAAAGAVYEKAASPQSQALPFSAYAGRYANDFIGEAVVLEEGGGLVLRLGPSLDASFPLTHFDRDSFFFRPAKDTPNLSGAAFEIGPDQKAGQMTIGDFNGFGMGVLKRTAK
ncbi:CubicO group peptidase, beta-lactamase class C family [Methylocapsa palsarum]|uniref:CubicO group peptidase, beta-lactamase class C family n=2 Tax=Methylocapsa palsarum TaxID=1612308 RepID=A0A1I4A5Z5_9HYPH|nr:serine hydrolase [Methylocapsa palsarum]SFK51744.1 CubicO group peptidase, beta-lactamase class C family [Methylocapsa palsarum]